MDWSSQELRGRTKQYALRVFQVSGETPSHLASCAGRSDDLLRNPSPTFEGMGRTA
ncbi:hypothetical protein Pan181_46850 [Aeoliella mucimassa]|uniref:Uncharacterized protein n=1 Tax=Aeoliella mucimassa TaxID=2527972 RepID=A0A518AUP7_9BACT|nr:hypothetical protein Pan181_46850 [Aeoliella mucimassa]